MTLMKKLLKVQQENSKDMIKKCELLYNIKDNNHKLLYNKRPKEIIMHFDALFLNNKATI